MQKLTLIIFMLIILTGCMSFDSDSARIKEYTIDDIQGTYWDRDKDSQYMEMKIDGDMLIIGDVSFEILSVQWKTITFDLDDGIDANILNENCVRVHYAGNTWYFQRRN